jgi:hypothetical protein
VCVFPYFLPFSCTLSFNLITSDQPSRLLAISCKLYAKRKSEPCDTHSCIRKVNYLFLQEAIKILYKFLDQLSGIQRTHCLHTESPNVETEGLANLLHILKPLGSITGPEVRYVTFWFTSELSGKYWDRFLPHPFQIRIQSSSLSTLY